MEETPVRQEEPPNSLPLHCVIKEEEPQINWHAENEEPSAQNSKFYFLAVEYVNDIKPNALQFSPYPYAITENEGIGQVDPNLSSSGRYSPLYNAFVIPTTIREEFNNSVVVLPAPRNQINIYVDPAQASKSLILEEHDGNGNVENVTLKTAPTQWIINQTGFENQFNIQDSASILGDKVIITTTADFVPSGIPDAAITESSNITAANTFFCAKEDKSRPADEFIAAPCEQQVIAGGEYSAVEGDSAGQVPVNEQHVENKPLMGSSDYVMQQSELKEDGLLPASEQNNDLLMSHANLEVDAYNLTEETYNAPEDASNYGTVEEQLNMTMEKPDNEYLLPDAIPFEDTETNILQSNLEVFASQEIENNDLLLFDKSRLRPPKRHSADNIEFDYWCEDCDDALGVKCSNHQVKVIQDKPVPSRARATLPKEYLVINKLNGDANEEGVFARKTIPKRTQFGPIEGVLMKDAENGAKDGSERQIKLLLEVETGEFLTLDVSREDQSNWMRFVRPAKTLKEQNLVLTQQGISLYFTTTQVIPPRHELKVWYGGQYAEKRKLEILKDLSWACFECPAVFSSSAELQKHLNIHEGDKESNSSVPKKRSKTVLSKGVPHLLRVKGNNRNREAIQKSSITKDNECWSCHRIFPRTYSLKRHLLLAHSEKDKENSAILLEENKSNDSDKASVVNTLFKKKISNGTGSEWLCTHCNLTFDNPSVLNLHTLTHAAEDLESEAVSGKRNFYGLPSELSSVYHEGEFLIENGDIQCPQCTREFSSKRELIDHVSTHGKMTQKKCCSNSAKPYKCDQCYKTFASDTSLQKHMLVHGGDETKPFQCDTCFKRFLNNSALACHLKTHCDKKCFECPICKEEFAQVFGLKEHVKTHCKGGHFTCPHCNKIFDGYSVIRKHIRAFHSGHQHICNDCGKLCPTLDKLRMHSLKHSDHREFLCANCGKQFKRKDKLKEHMKRMHSAEREMKMLSSALRIPSTKDRRFNLKMSPMAYDRFVYKCRNCMVGFKRRGMLVNHLAKRHPDIIPDTVPELNLPIMKTTRDYFCQYCDKIYKSSSKRKAHILKNHPGAELPLSNRQKGGIPDIPGMPNPTFSQTVGSVKTTPQGCQWCHKQYASKAKLLQHQRKKHSSMLPQPQQTPRHSRNADSPVGDEISGGDNIKLKGVGMSSRKMENRPAVKFSIPTEVNNQGIYITKAEVCQVISHDLPEVEYKRIYKNTQDNMSNDFMGQTITELNNVYTDYKLSFAAPQEHLLKMIEVKEGTDGIVRDDVILTAQVSRAWPNMPPFPPR